MKNIQNKKKLQVIIFVLIAVTALGVGYATLTAINLIISGNAGGRTKELNYEVKFMSVEGVTPQFHSDYEGVSGTATVTSDTTATFSVTGFTVEGQTATAKYKVKNSSTGVGTRISLNLEYTNTEYFKVREYIEDTELKAGEETEVTVTVELYQLPFESNTTVTTSINARLIAEPINNGGATGNDSASVGELTSKYKYSISNNQLGQALNGELSSFDVAKTTFGYPISSAYIVSGGVITETYVAFEKNNKVYYLRGGVNEYDLSERTIYDENSTILKEVFGPNWQSVCDDYTTQISCSSGDLYAFVNVDGRVWVEGDHYEYECGINDAGGSYCRHDQH